MKKILLPVAVLISIISTSAFAKNIHVQMDGVVCPSCIDKTKKAISSIDKNNVVESVAVDYQKLTFDVKTKGDGDLDDSQIKAAIKEKGYLVTEISREDSNTKYANKKSNN